MLNSHEAEQHFLVLHPCAQHLAGSSAVLQTRPLQPEAVDPWLRSLLASRLCRLSFRFLDSTSEHCTLRLRAWKSESTKFCPPALQETSLARWIAQVGNYVCSLVLSSTYGLEFLCQIISFSLHLRTYHCNNSANNERATDIILAHYPHAPGPSSQRVLRASLSQTQRGATPHQQNAHCQEGPRT